MNKQTPSRDAPPPYQAVSQYPFQGTRQTFSQPQQGYGTVNNAYSHTTIIQQHAVPIVVVGGCPSCRVGVLEDDYTCLGVCCAIVFFPLGLLCCLAMKERRCPNCGAVFG